MSEITAITAGIGGGKTLLATQIAFKELLKGHRFVVTNAPLELEQIRYDYYRITGKPFPDHRVRLITTEEVKRWWLCLPGRDLKSISEVADRQKTDTGCVYLLDEFHLVYPAREWAQTAKEVGPDVETYVSQLRKVNDDLYWITQHREKVDKNFRRNTTTWCVVKNLGKARLLLGVGMPDKFAASYFPQEPVGKDKPEYSTFYNRIVKFGRHTVDYGKQYRTMAGIGFAGQKEAEDKPKRRHWSIWIAFAVFLVILAWFIPRMFSTGAGAFIGYNTGGFEKSFRKSAGVPDIGVPGSLESAGAAVPAPSTGRTAAAAVVAPPVAGFDTNEVMVSGWDFLEGYPRVVLTDGRILRADTLNMYDGALIKGRFYRMKLKPTEMETESKPIKHYDMPAPIQTKIQYKVISVGRDTSREFFPTGDGSVRSSSQE